MTEEEYLQGEFPDDDDDIMEGFLIEEPDDLDLVMLPKLEFDLELELEKYYKMLKSCRNKEQLIQVLRIFYAHISSVVLLQSDIQYLQDRAKELEFNIEVMRQQNY